MTKRFMMVLSALLILGVQAFAQNAVSGKVTDASGEPLVGVNVLVKGTTTGAMTDHPGLLLHRLRHSGSRCRRQEDG